MQDLSFVSFLIHALLQSVDLPPAGIQQVSHKLHMFRGFFPGHVMPGHFKDQMNICRCQDMPLPVLYVFFHFLGSSHNIRIVLVCFLRFSDQVFLIFFICSAL